MASPAREGLARLRELAGQLPDQLRQGFRTGVDLDFSLSPRLTHWAAAGMGGSAIASDLLAGILARETDRTLSVHRGPALPKAVNDRWLVVCTSYSGNTWETLAAYDQAGAAGATRLVVSSGGALADRAADDGVPCLIVPPGSPPRAAVGFLLGGLLGVVDAAFPESNEDRVEAAAGALVVRLRSLMAPGAGPARLAQRIGARSPLIYVDAGHEALARRWKTQIEENAKRLAQFDTVPELLHNALVPWDVLPPAEVSRRAVVLLEPTGGDRRLAKRFRYLERLLARRKVTVGRVPLVGPDPLLALLTGVAWGDLVSLAMAERARVDPMDIRALEDLKRAFGPR